MSHRLILCAALCLVACGGKATPPPPVHNAAPPDPVAAPAPPAKTESQTVMDKMEAFATRMCGCVDRPCADTVQEDMTRWSTEMANRSSEELQRKASEDEMKRMTEVGQKYAECMTKAMTATP